MNDSETPFGGIWEDDEVIDKGVGYPEENPDGENAESGEGQEAPKPDAMDELAAELDGVAEGKEPTSKVVKGLSRVISRKDRELAAQREQVAQLEAYIRQQNEYLQTLAERFDTTEEALKLNWEVLTGNLHEEDARNAELALYKRNQEMQQRRMTQRQVQAQQQAQRPQAQQPTPQYDTTITDFLRREHEEFLATARDLVANAGLDAADPNLDYGTDQEKFNERLKRLNASIKKAKSQKTEDEVASVRGKPVATRGSSGGTVPVVYDGESLLKRGSSEWLKMMR